MERKICENTLEKTRIIRIELDVSIRRWWDYVRDGRLKESYELEYSGEKMVEERVSWEFYLPERNERGDNMEER